jgi:thiopeptide-type bacteriocin biosynthesis protein
VAAPLAWVWGAIDSLPFLPRVVSGRLILSPARWTLGPVELGPLAATREPERPQALAALRERLQLPRLVILEEGDQSLLLDLDDPISAESLWQLARKGAGVRLSEALSDVGDLCVNGPEGRFLHELVVPFVRQPSPGAASAAMAGPRSPLATRPRPRVELEETFAPGSEWLFAKLYCGPATADHVLSRVVDPLRRQALAEGAAHGWFFLRFSDPDRHLRVRLRGPAARLRGEVLARLHELCQPLLQQRTIWRLQFDTYERETLRYGGPAAITLAEDLFQADSDAVLGLLDVLSEGAPADARWQVALRGVNALLDDFGLELSQKLRIVTALAEAFAREFDVKPVTAHRIAGRYRGHRAAVERALSSQGFAETLPGVDLALRRRSQEVSEVAARYRALAGLGELGRPLPDIVGSFVHMFLNRLLRGAQRAQEMVLYEYLRRGYESQLARQRGRGGRS